jgi:hypothetical protein
VIGSAGATWFLIVARRAPPGQGYFPLSLGNLDDKGPLVSFRDRTYDLEAKHVR